MAHRIADMRILNANLDDSDFDRIARSFAPVMFTEEQEFLPADYTGSEAIVMIAVQAPPGSGAPAIGDCAMYVDVPDVIEVGTVTTSGSAEVNVTFTKSFLIPPTVNGSLIGGTSLAVVDITNVTNTGFSISLRNASWTRVVGTVAWHASGF